MNCLKCGNELNPNMKFCAKCGTPVTQQFATPSENIEFLHKQEFEQPISQTTNQEYPQMQPNRKNHTSKEFAQTETTKNQPKSKKNSKIIIIVSVILVLTLSILGVGGIFVADSILYKKEQTANNFITDFPILKQKTDFLVYDAENFPYQEYKITVERASSGKLFKSSAFNSYETVIKQKSENPIFNIDFQVDGRYKISLEGITSSRIQQVETTTTQKETKTIVFIVIVDNDNEKAVDKVTINSKKDDKPIANFDNIALSQNNSKTTLTVPSFIGSVYNEEFKAQHSQINFKIIEEINHTVSPFTILSQTPSAGEKIDPEKEVVELVIAVSNEYVQIPSDLEGKDYIAVKNELIRLNLELVEQAVDYSEIHADNGFHEGSVIDVTPAPGSMVAPGTKVTITYLKYNETIVMPDVVGQTKDNAVRILESNGLKVKLEHDYSNNVQRDYVISTSIPKGTSIPKNAEVIITVSLGPTAKRTATVDITLPNTYEYGTITATLNGVNILTDDDYYLDGSSYSISVNGYQPDSVLKVFVNGKTLFTCSLDFTVNPVEISNMTVYEYAEEKSPEPEQPKMILMPDVIGDTIEDAKSKLAAAGFDISNIYTIVNGYNTVTLQYPPSGQKYPENINITLQTGEYN